MSTETARPLPVLPDWPSGALPFPATAERAPLAQLVELADDLPLDPERRTAERILGRWADVLEDPATIAAEAPRFREALGVLDERLERSRHELARRRAAMRTPSIGGVAGLLQELRAQEIRRHLLSLAEDERHALVWAAESGGDRELLSAVATAPSALKLVDDQALRGCLAALDPAEVSEVGDLDLRIRRLTDTVATLRGWIDASAAS